jgi:hypothetical protein
MRRCAPNDARHERGAWKSLSNTVTEGRARGTKAFPPSTHVVGIAWGLKRKSFQSGWGTASPVQTSCVSLFDNPVADAACENRFELTVLRNSPTPPRTIVGLAPPPRPPKAPARPPGASTTTEAATACTTATTFATPATPATATALWSTDGPREADARTHVHFARNEVGALAERFLDGRIVRRLLPETPALDACTVRELHVASCAPDVAEVDRGVHLEPSRTLGCSVRVKLVALFAS